MISISNYNLKMNQNMSKRKKFNNEEFIIESNHNEIICPTFYNNSELYDLQIKESKDNSKNTMQYFPIVTNESLKGKSTIYLATENSEINKKEENNTDFYNNYYINSRNTKLKNKLMNLKKNINSKSITDRKDNFNKNKIIINKEPQCLNIETIQFNKNIKQKIEKKISHSFSVDNYLELNNKLLLNFRGGLENSKILGKNFINGIKNIKRKNNLMNAIEKYKRFKSLGKLSINNYLNNAFSSEFGFNNNIYNKKNTERINTLDKTNTKIIEEENENETENEKEKSKKNKKIIEINKIKIKNIINLNKLNSINSQNKKKIKENLSSYIINNNKKCYIKNIKKYIKPNNENVIKEPKILVRRILREERYIIDENGKEKLLGVSQSFLPKVLNLNKLETINKSNIRTNNKTNIDDKIISKEKYKNEFKNNKINTNRKLIKINSQNIFNEQSKKNVALENMTSYNSNNNKSINGNILEFLKKKEKPILIKKLPNKIEKINLFKFNEIKNLSKSFINGTNEPFFVTKKNNNNHLYHEINSFRERDKNTKSPIIDEKKRNLLINKSSRQINSLKNSFILNQYMNNRNDSKYFYRINSENNRNSSINSNDYEDINRGHHKNYSIHEIVDLRNKNSKKII